MNLKQIDDLTPVEYNELYNIYIKREDLYKPYEEVNINVTKLREAMLIIEDNIEIAKKYGVVTGCSIPSPQAPIIAQICKT